MYGMRQVGVVGSPFTETSQIPKGRGAEREAEGFGGLEPEFAQGLADSEGFSHLYLSRVFHASEGCELMGIPPTARTASSPRARHTARIRRGRRWCGCSVARGAPCASAAWTCSTARPSSTSSRIHRTFPRATGAAA